MPEDFNGLDVFWDGHAAVRVRDGDFTLAADPSSEVSPDFSADIVLLTGEDRVDVGKLDEVCHDRTCAVIPEDAESEPPCIDVERIRAGELIEIYGVEIEAFEAEEGLGYRFVMDGSSIYVAGKAALSEAAFDLENRVDLAFLPVTGSMDIEGAVEYAVRVKPEKVVPYLYGPPSLEDVNTRPFAAELEDRSIGSSIIDPEPKN
ncbi:MAG: MBL fold metallo-hydrolase [Candidatus Nanohaloarchaea archaeon]|nr:MBL fold metallo-hydrolase [Candidatus Nanohaloarchaea archaeon]